MSRFGPLQPPAARPRARDGALRTAICLAILSPAACRRPGPPADGRHWHTAEPVRNGFVTLRLRGVVSMNDPEGYKPVRPFVPIERLTPDGLEVERGDELFALDTERAAFWMADRQAAIEKTEAQRALGKLTAAHDVRGLERKQADLAQRKRIVEARIAATLKLDSAALRIAELELDGASRALRRAEIRVARLAPLAEGGLASRELTDRASDALERARADLRVSEVRLETLRSTTLAVQRSLLTLDRADLAVQLGDAEHPGGVFHDLAERRRALKLEDRGRASRLRKWYAEQERGRRLLSNNVTRAAQDGVLRHARFWSHTIGVGTKSWPASMAFVLRDEDMCFEVDLPERWRHLLSLHRGGDRTEILVRVPQLRLRAIPCVLASVSPLPRRTRVLGMRAYRCLLVPGEILPGLREGMRVECLLRVPVAPGALKVPVWAVSDPFAPRVQTVTGPRQVRGRALGPHFVVSEGLRPGEPVRAEPPAEREARWRYRGRILATATTSLKAPSQVEVAELVADGSLVKQGDVIARFASTSSLELDLAQEARYLREQAETALQVARARAEGELIKSYVAWKTAEVDVKRKRLEHLSARYARDAELEAAGTARVRKARIDWQARVREHEQDRASAAEGLLSAQRLREAALARAAAAVRLRQAELSSVLSRRGRNWLTVWNEQHEARQAEARAVEARSEYSLQREAFRLALLRAVQEHAGRMDEVRRKFERHEALTVLAPHDGRVYYDVGHDGRLLKPGQHLTTREPFRMPKTHDREVRVEIPARHYKRFAVGRRVPLIVPFLGREPVPGTVRSVSPHFHVSTAEQQGYAPAGARLVPMVFTVVVSVDVEVGTGSRLQPGLSAWVEVPAS